MNHDVGRSGQNTFDASVRVGDILRPPGPDTEAWVVKAVKVTMTHHAGKPPRARFVIDAEQLGENGQIS